MNKKIIVMCAMALVGVCAFGVGAKKSEAKSNLSTVGTRRVADEKRVGKNVVAQKLRKCDFLVNKKFKRDAKFYLCLFSASWCSPCRAEMPRISQTYLETLKDDPDIELIHFSRDQNDAKAMAWAKEHDVKFPVVKPRGGNPLDLRCKGIPHLFIVKADGTLIEEGHPMNIFNEEKFQEIKGGGPTTSVKSQVGNGDKAPSAQKEDFKAKLTGIAIIEGGHMGEYVTRADHAEFQDPDHPMEIPYGEAACFRVEYDFPEGYQAKVYVSGRWPQGQNMSRYILGGGGASFEAFFRGRGVAYGFLTMHEDVETCTLEQVAISVFAEPKLGGWKIAEPQVNVKFQGPETAVKKEVEIDGYTWSCFIRNSEARIVSPKGGLHKSAVSPKPAGDFVIPSLIDGAPVTMIGKFALCDSRELTSVEIPKTVTSIGEWAFDKCYKLTAVTIPSSVTCVGGAVFADCPELQEIGLEAGNPRYKVVDGVLYTKDMKRLVVGPGGKVSHTIPAGVTDIANDAFRCCRMLSSVMIPSGVTRIGDGAFCGTALKSVVIPPSVKKIEGSAFFCDELTSLRLSEGLESIGRFSFCGNSALTSVTIPSSVKYIGKEAFSGCKGLEAVTMCGEKPDSGDKVFDKCDNIKAIHVPSNAKSWAGMTEWQGFPLVLDGE